MAVTHNNIPHHEPEAVRPIPDNPALDTADAIVRITDRDHLLISDNNAAEILNRARNLSAASKIMIQKESGAQGADVIPLSPRQN